MVFRLRFIQIKVLIGSLLQVMPPPQLLLVVKEADSIKLVEMSPVVRFLVTPVQTASPSMELSIPPWFTAVLTMTQ